MEAFKKFWKWFRWVLLAALGALGFLAGKKVIDQVVKFSQVKKSRLFTKLDDKTIAILDDNLRIEHRVPLPINPDTGKRITVDEIQAVGVSNGGEEIHVEIKHNPIDRSGR